MSANDKAEIDEITKRFYALFTNREGIVPNVAGIHELFITEGLIVKTCGNRPEVYDLRAFVEPRERLLRGGELTDFEEEEVRERTSIMGYVAQRFSIYRKAGVFRGQPMQARGVKAMQFVRANGVWKLSAVAWDDERDGFKLEMNHF